MNTAMTYICNVNQDENDCASATHLQKEGTLIILKAFREVLMLYMIRELICTTAMCGIPLTNAPGTRREMTDTAMSDALI